MNQSLLYEIRHDACTNSCPNRGVASNGACAPSTSNNFLFTALHAMQTRSSDENSVRLSVRPSHACIVTKR